MFVYIRCKFKPSSPTSEKLMHGRNNRKKLNGFGFTGVIKSCSFSIIKGEGTFKKILETAKNTFPSV